MSGRSAARATTSSRGPRNGRAMYVHAGGSPQALTTSSQPGQRPARLQRRRVPPWRLLPADHQPGRAAQPVHDRPPAPPAGHPAQGDAPPKPIWTFLPPAPLERRPVGGRITFAYPQNAIRYDYDRRHQHVPALGDRRGRPARRLEQGPDRPDQRDDHVDEVRAAQRRRGLQAPPRGDDRGQRPGLDRDERATRSRAPGRRPRSRARPCSTTAPATRSA